MMGIKEWVTTNEWVRNTRQSVEVADAKSQNGTTYETLLKKFGRRPKILGNLIGNATKHSVFSSISERESPKKTLFCRILTFVIVKIFSPAAGCSSYYHNKLSQQYPPGEYHF